MRTSRRSLTIAALALAAGCSVNPVTHKPEISLIPEKKEREMGREEAEKVRASIGIVEDRALTEYVTQIGERLVAHAPAQGETFQFQIVDMVEPNAFALPGGYVYVSRGLLALANSEDELANVIGHEAGHVLAHHATQRMTLAAPFALISSIGGLATGIVSPRLGRIVAGATGLPGGLLLAGYSRDQEREADHIGMELAAKSGWSPAAMSSFMFTLEREEELRSGGPQRWSFFASHPTTPERVADTGRRARSLPHAEAKPIAAGHDAFLVRLEGLLIGPNPAAGAFVKDAFLHPELGFALEIPQTWHRENAPAQVVAGPEDKKGVVILTSAEKGGDPMKVAERIGKEMGFDAAKDTERWQIGGLDAVHVEVSARADRTPVRVDATWIAFDGTVYQIAGVCEPADYAALRPAFHRIARSFHRLTTDELKSITAGRLRIREARAGETVAELVKRTGSSWSAEEAAIANGLETGTTLAKGKKLKVAITEPWKE